MAEPKKSHKRLNTVAKRRRILPGITDEEEEAEPRRNPRPGTTAEARESQLIAMTIDLAARQIKAGTVSSQVMTHFLKLATAKEKLERDQLKYQNGLLQAKTENLKSSKEMKDLVSNALAAMKTYSGNSKSATSVEIDEDGD